MELKETTVKSETIYSGRILRLLRDDIMTADGKSSVREVVVHRGGVTVAALNERDELLLVRQYRYPAGEVLTELPAGKLEEEEDPYDAVIRELREETGAVADEVISLGWFYASPGYTSEKLWLYAARGLKFGERELDDDENLDVLRVPFEEAVENVLRGDGYHDAKTDAAIMKLALLREKGMI